MRLVFYIEDDDGTIIGEKKQMKIELTESELIAADERDAPLLDKANGLIGEHYANFAVYGRSKYCREFFTALGTIVGKCCYRMCAKKLGVQRMFDLLDKHVEEHPKEIGL